jgi:hypothetical protein
MMGPRELQRMNSDSKEKKIVRKRSSQLEPRSQKRQKLLTSSSSHKDLLEILKNYEEKAPDASGESSSTSVWIWLNVILDHSTFEKSLMQHDLSMRQHNNVVPLLTRAYEESFMRECMLPEDKPCSLGQFCECNFIDAGNEFVGVSFVMPDLRAGDSNMCILCLRKLTQMLFYRTINGGYKPSQLIQLYGNICDVAGEYHSSAMLVMPRHGAVQSMPLPVVAHQRSKYQVVIRNGKRHLTQKNVYYEDFP